MSNVIQFRSKRPGANAEEKCRAIARLETAALRTSARDALNLLTAQFETAIRQVRAIEPRIRDPKRRQAFADQIEFTRRLLDEAHLKILQL